MNCLTTATFLVGFIFIIHGQYNTCVCNDMAKPSGKIAQVQKVKQRDLAAADTQDQTPAQAITKNPREKRSCSQCINGSEPKGQKGSPVDSGIEGPQGVRGDHQEGRERVVGLQEPEERKVVTVGLEEAKEPEQNEGEGAPQDHLDHQDNQEQKDHKVLQDP